MPILASGITINSESYHMKLSIISYFALPHNLYKAVSELMEAELLSYKSQDNLTNLLQLSVLSFFRI